jgi:hypothetical protein
MTDQEKLKILNTIIDVQIILNYDCLDILTSSIESKCSLAQKQKLLNMEELLISLEECIKKINKKDHKKLLSNLLECAKIFKQKKNREKLLLNLEECIKIIKK